LITGASPGAMRNGVAGASIVGPADAELTNQSHRRIS
jgi:hypothetical protein